MEARSRTTVPVIMTVAAPALAMSLPTSRGPFSKFYVVPLNSTTYVGQIWRTDHEKLQDLKLHQIQIREHLAQTFQRGLFKIISCSISFPLRSNYTSATNRWDLPPLLVPEIALDT